MKKSLLLAFSFITAGALAQPTLTASGCNLVVGDQIPQSTSTYASPGSAGTSQSWDLSSMTTANTATITAVTPASTTNGASFPSANVAINTASGNAYYKTSTTAWQNYGSDAGGVVIAYTNPEDFMHWPFTYNNTFNDAFAATFTTSGFTVYRSGTVSITADGYGTVITPAGSFSNVLRIHMVEIYKDSSNILGTDIINDYNNDEYLWMDNSHHIPLATVSSFTTVINGGSPNTSQTGSFFGAPVGIATHNALISEVQLFPNPAANNLHVQMELTKGEQVTVKIFNALGTEVSPATNINGTQGLNKIGIDVSKLGEGVYFAQICLNGVPVGTRRFVVAR